MIIPVLLLLSLGIVVIYSSSPTLALQQAVFSVIGLIFYFGLRLFDYRTYYPLIKYSYLIVFVLLLITLFLGFETRGSIRWIPLGFFNLQPSELAKPVVILFVARFWASHSPTWRNIFLSFISISPILFLIFRQPDLGTTLTVLFIWISMLFYSHISIGKILTLVSGTLLLLPPFWFILQDYQKQRIISFLSPYRDPQGIGFHVIQSTIAVGSGQLFGRGLGRGTQSRLQFLPEFRTDFIFASITEELGFLGGLIILSLYALVFYFCFRILSRAGDRFGELIVVGVMGMIFFQMIINIGMNIGLLPITGITLPLLSYGGSSIITTLISLGLVSSVSRYGTKRKDIPVYEL